MEHTRRILVKVGGETLLALDDRARLAADLRQVLDADATRRLCVVHGAGPQITALATRHISLSPASRSVSLKTGMNAAAKAPSPSRRRNRFGTMNASTNAPATQPSPMNRA